jgi:hypothetical protein
MVEEIGHIIMGSNPATKRLRLIFGTVREEVGHELLLDSAAEREYA